MRAADHEGYMVAMNEMPMATNATRTPSSARGAKRYVVDRVDLGRQRDEMVVGAGPRKRIAKHQSDRSTDHPISNPCATNKRRTCDFRVPIESSTAMSLVFSITIMVSEIRMLSAATKTIRPMVMKVTRRSSRNARNRARFCSIQLVAMKPVPAACSSSLAMRRPGKCRRP